MEEVVTNGVGKNIGSKKIQRGRIGYGVIGVEGNCTICGRANPDYPQWERAVYIIVVDEDRDWERVIHIGNW